MSNNTIHQLTFAVKQYNDVALVDTEDAFYFGDATDFFSDNSVF